MLKNVVSPVIAGVLLSIVVSINLSVLPATAAELSYDSNVNLASRDEIMVEGTRLSKSEIEAAYTELLDSDLSRTFHNDGLMNLVTFTLNDKI